MGGELGVGFAGDRFAGEHDWQDGDRGIEELDGPGFGLVAFDGPGAPVASAQQLAQVAAGNSCEQRDGFRAI